MGRRPGSKSNDPLNIWRNILVDDGCWMWTGSVDLHGYGRAYFGGKTTKAHKWMYERFVGPVPEGLELDHLCRTPGCVRWDHLEPVTHAENVRRGAGPTAVRAIHAAKTHCKRGHPLEGCRTYVRDGRTIRACRRCAVIASTEHRKRKRGAES